MTENNEYILIIPIEPIAASRPQTGQGRAYYKKPYAAWRKRVNLWFIDYLKETDFKLIKFLAGGAEGYSTLRTVTGEPRRADWKDDEGKIHLGRLRGNLRPDFDGWQVDMTFVVERPANQKQERIHPMSGTGDLDNYVKATVDAIFQLIFFKRAGFDDRYIQKTVAEKRYTVTELDEKPHIEVVLRYL